MPTNHPRILVTKDPELAEALARAARYVDADVKQATLVRELAIRGAQALLDEAEARRQAIERLIDMSVNRTPLLDWDILERIEEIQLEMEGLPPADE